MVGINKYADSLGHRLLLSQLLGTPCSVVADMCPQVIQVGDHTGKAARSADALLLAHLFHGNDILAIEFLPCPDGHHVIQGDPNP